MSNRLGFVSARWPAWVALACLIFACPDRAAASENYPEVLEEELALDFVPICTICHSSDEGGDDTVVMPFGITMQRLGVSGDKNRATLRAALAAAETYQIDSDFDGVSDVNEIRVGTDPNDGVALQFPRTGCAVATSRIDQPALTLALATLGLGLAGFCRQRARTRKGRRNASSKC